MARRMRMRVAPEGDAMRPRSFFAAATIFAAAVCAAPVHAGFLISDIDTSWVVSPLTFSDIDRAVDVEPGASWWLPGSNPTANNPDLLEPIGPYYVVSDSLTGNMFIFTGTWMDIGNCTADKCISDLKGRDDPLAVQGRDDPLAVQAVPEPGTVMLFSLAFGLLGFMTRRRDG